METEISLFSTFNPPATLLEIEDDQYDHIIISFNQHCKESKIIPSPESLKAYIEGMIGFFEPATIDKAKVGLKKAILKTYPENAEFELKITKLFKTIKTPKSDKRVYSEILPTPEEIDLLLSGSPVKVIDQRSKKEKTIICEPTQKERMFIQILRDTGMRISEVINLQKKSITRQGDFAYLTFIGKGLKERRNFVLTRLIDECEETFNGNKFLFEDPEFGIPGTKEYSERYRKRIWYRLYFISKLLLNKTIHPHSFRHYFANKLLREGKSLKSIQQWLGHSSSAITSDMYIHDELSPDDLY